MDESLLSAPVWQGVENLPPATKTRRSVYQKARQTGFALEVILSVCSLREQSAWYRTASGSERDKDASKNLDLLSILISSLCLIAVRNGWLSLCPARYRSRFCTLRDDL